MSNGGLEVHVGCPHSPTDSSSKIVYHQYDLSESLVPLFREVHPDLIISTTSGGSFDTQRKIIDSAIEAEVPRFIAPEFGQDSLNGTIQERLPPSRERARMIEYLGEQASNGKITWVGIATGTTLDRGLLSGNLGVDLKWQSATMHGEGHEHFAASSSAWIGQVTLAVIEYWEQVKNTYLYAAGLITSANEVVKSLERATAKQFEVGRSDVEQCVQEAERRLKSGFPDAGMFLMERSILYDERMGAARPFEANDAKERLGLKTEKLEAVIRGVLHDEEHHGGKPSCGCD